MFKPTLTKRFLFAFLMVTLIPLAVATWGSIRKAEFELQSSINEGLELEAKQITSFINNQYLSSWDYHLRLLAELINEEDNLSVSRLNRLMNVFLKTNPEIVMSELRIPNATQALRFYKKSAFETGDLKAILINEELAERDFENAQKIKIGRVISYKNQLYIPAAKKLDWVDGKSAVLQVYFQMKNIDQFIHDEFLRGSSHFYIVNKSGQVIFRSPDAFYKKDEQLQFSFLADLENLIRNKNNIRKIEPFEFQGLDYVGFFSNFSAMNWGIVIIDNASNAYALIEAMKADIIYWILLAIALCLIFSLFFTRSLTKSILVLTQVADQIGQGNLQQEILITSRDEIGTLANALREMMKHLQERVNMMRFISRSTASMIAEKENIQNVVERRKITAFFSDIRGFTAFSENRDPEEVISMLNTYLSVQAKIINDFGGEIDKFVGDEIFAIFFGPEHEKRAVQAAKEVQKQLEVVRQTEKEKIHVGIGIHSGETVMGTIGFGDRMDHTVLGSTVNLAARLCSHAKADQILISSAIFECLDLQKEFVSGEKIDVKGFSEAVQIYKCLEVNK